MKLWYPGKPIHRGGQMEMQTALIEPRACDASEADRVQALREFFCTYLCDDPQDGSTFDCRVLDVLDSIAEKSQSPD